MSIHRIAMSAFVLSLASCASQPGMESRDANGAAASDEVTSESPGATTEAAAEIERIRQATAAFKSLDAAVAAGYAGHVMRCIDNPPHGAMGYHHQNDALLDDHLEIEAPEMLVYEKMPDGEYRLNGVEYIVPFSHRPATAEAPVLMGQKLKPAPSLNLWYLHVWAWTDNPSGVFADWNPKVACE